MFTFFAPCAEARSTYLTHFFRTGFLKPLSQISAVKREKEKSN